MIVSKTRKGRNSEGKKNVRSTEFDGLISSTLKDPNFWGNDLLFSTIQLPTKLAKYH
jgi:hypothetical protein